ncbi:MAG: leucine-rich repeat protein, partial [Clostridia bacterium]|nr:leucine-rich repeat protein [Clostridia bacterium]
VNHSGSIDTFGSNSFRLCNKLTEFVIPEQVKEIPDSMFEDCSVLTNVTAKGVISVGKSAFDYCELLKSVQLSSELNTVKERGFYYCKELESIGTNGENITELGKHAFEETAIKSFVFSGDLVTITDSCFYRSQLSQIVISEGVENIEGHAFYACENLEAIVLPDSLKTVGNDAFRYCENATEFKLSENLKTIGENAFGGCKSVKESKLTIDKNVESIGDYAFSGMSFDSLYYNCIDFRAISVYTNDPTYTDAFKGVLFNEITLGPDVRLLCEKIFEGQSEITNLTVPENVKIIEESVFANCTKLEALIIEDGVEEIMDNAFSGCSSLTEFTVPVTVKKFAGTALPNNLTTCYFNAENCVFTSFAGTTYGISVSPFQSSIVENVVIGNTVKRIPDYFLAHYRLSKSVVIPDSVIEIGEYAFAHSLIKDVKFSSNLVLIDKGAFRFSGIQNRGRFLPDSLRIIGPSVFEECQSLTEIYFPDSLVHIDESAFYDCRYITRVRMSPNVKYLKDSAFSTCISLKEFEWDTDVKLIGENAFRSCKSLSEFDFRGVELLYPSSFLNSGVKTVVLGEDKNEEASALVSIEEQSFKDCTDLETLSIGGNVATIKSQAFAECENLETAVISDSVVNIASDAFDGCDSLTICCMEDSYAYDYAVENNITVTTFVIAPIPNQVYTGNKIEPDVDVSMSNKQLTEQTDFSVKYSDNINVGTAKVSVRGKGIYKALASIANFTIITKNIASATVAEIADQNYTGSPVTPSITVTDGGKILKEGTDYTLTYKNNTNVGKATATIQGKGNYSGTKNVEFNINELTFFQRVKNAFVEFFAIIKAWFTSIFS